MSKALVIKGADFGANKVTTITFGSVPCEGISFASDTITITDQNPVTVEYTLTPSNTTDPVVWASSDTDVITVSSGVLTVVGIGTATLTATCGNFTATASVTVSIAYIPGWIFKYLSKAESKSFLSCANHSGNKFIGPFGTGAQECEYKIIRSDGSANVSPIKIPNGTNTIRISRGDSYATMFYGANRTIYWLRDVSCGDTDAPEGALYVGESVAGNMRTNASVTIPIPTNLGTIDCCAFAFQLSDTPSDTSDPNGFAETYGMNIEFLKV